MGIDSGGNLGAAPGRVLYRGVIATKGFNDKRDEMIATKVKYPLLTAVQERNSQTFQSAKIDVVDLDTSFLYIGHIDEAISILKTKDPAPCDFVILRPSMEKALELTKKYPLKQSMKIKSDTASREKIERILKSNAETLAEKVAKATGCGHPKIIEVPTISKTGNPYSQIK